MSEWQPISTAPRDGTLILGCIMPPKAGHGFSGAWKFHFEQHLAPVTVAWRPYHPNQKGKEQWRIASGNPYRPSHWMPLPPHPTPTEGQDSDE